MRAGRSFPVAGPHQHFAVLPALLAMKFVDRHGETIARLATGVQEKTFRAKTAKSAKSKFRRRRREESLALFRQLGSETPHVVSYIKKRFYRTSLSLARKPGNEHTASTC